MIIENILHRMSFLKPSSLLCSFKNISRTKKQRKSIKKRLLGLGFASIKNNEPHTWKIYDNNGFRITLTAKKDNNYYLIKIDSDKKRFLISANFYSIFKNSFSFVPHGYSLFFDDYCMLLTEYIAHTTFFETKTYIKKHYEEYLKQALSILNHFNEYKIIHCDLGEYNIIFEKKTMRMLLIDFDTWHSDLFPEKSCRKPPRRQTYKENGQSVFDDAYCFCKIFTKLNIKNLTCNKRYIELQSMIGMNTYRW